jgi:hypothetical protein
MNCAKRLGICTIETQEKDRKMHALTHALVQFLPFSPVQKINRLAFQPVAHKKSRKSGSNRRFSLIYSSLCASGGNYSKIARLWAL